MPFLRQSTIQAVNMGPFLDITDGVTEEVALTITQALRQVSKDGGGYAQTGTTGNATHDKDGHYTFNLSAADTNTVGELKVMIQIPATALPVWEKWWVLEEAVYDAIYGAAATVDVNVIQWLGTAAATPTVAGVPEVDVTHMAGGVQTVTDLKDFADAGYDPVTNKVQGVVLVDTTTTNTDMAGTNSAALAVDVGTLADAAAAGDPTSADTLMQYVKQLINILTGTTGITTFPAEAAPGNNVSLAEIIRAIHSDVTGLAGATMRGTDSGALASVATEARLSELDAATSGKMANQMDIVQTDTTTDIPATITTVDTVVDGIQTDLDNATDGLGALKTLIDAIQVVVDKIPLSDGAVTWNTTALASINAEVDTAFDTAISELSQGVPTSTPTMRTGLMLMYMALRNKLDVATVATDTLEIHNDAGTRIAQKLLTDDGTDYSEAKMISGA